MKKTVRRISLASVLVLLVIIITGIILPGLPAQAITLVSTQECWGAFVGVGAYQHYSTYSNIWDSDAQGLYNEISPTWGASHTRLLTNTGAKKSDILDSINWLASHADSNDTVLFYISALGESPNHIICYDSSSIATDISPTELGNAIDSINAGKIIVILQVWHSGNFISNLSGSNRVIITSSGVNESAWLSSSISHSYFGLYLIQAFQHFSDADTNDDYELSAEEVYEYARPLATAAHSDQHPQINDQYSGDLPILAKFTFDDNISLPSGATILTLDGTNYTSPPLPRLWIPGTSHTVVVPETVTGGSGTRYAFTGWDDGNTATTRTVTKGSYVANYEKQYELQVTSTYGNPTGAGWYKDGSAATFSVTPYIETSDTKRYLTGWSGDYSGTSASSSIVMNGPKKVTANWRMEYLLTVNSDYGSPTGSGWYNEAATATFSVTSYIETPDTKYYFTGWSGDFTGTGASGTIYMGGPMTVTASWRFEYLLTINSEYGTPTGAGWYKQDETATVYVEPTQGFLIRHIFNGWSGDLSDTQPSSSINMYSPKTITATWRADYIQLIILIVVVVVLGVGITVTLVLVRGKGQPKPPRQQPPPTYTQPPTYPQQPPPTYPQQPPPTYPQQPPPPPSANVPPPPPPPPSA
jgi:hypothetical protein